MADLDAATMAANCEAAAARLADTGNTADALDAAALRAAAAVHRRNAEKEERAAAAAAAPNEPRYWWTERE